MVLGEAGYEGYSWQEMCRNLDTKENILSSESLSISIWLKTMKITNTTNQLAK